MISCTIFTGHCIVLHSEASWFQWCSWAWCICHFICKAGVSWMLHIALISTLRELESGLPWDSPSKRIRLWSFFHESRRDKFLDDPAWNYQFTPEKVSQKLKKGSSPSSIFQVQLLLSVLGSVNLLRPRFVCYRSTSRAPSDWRGRNTTRLRST